MKRVLNNQTGSNVLLMGNEAIARGALEAGVQLVAAYPGTPSSEIGEVLGDVTKETGVYFEWSTNETIAFEVAAGASLVGARSMTMMKNAGFNLVMDMFMTLTYGGIKGGFVIVSADDPSAHYSSNEQDTRLAGIYGEVMVFEPQNQNQAKNMTKEAFNISEKLELPVMLRSVTRISHASGNVQLGELKKGDNTIGFNKHWKMPYRWNVYGPPGPINKHKWLHSKFKDMKEYVEESSFNTLEMNGSDIGIITSGIAATYMLEVLDEFDCKDKVNILNLGIINPIPEKMATKILKGSSKIIVIEEGDPAVENAIRLLAKEVSPNTEIYGKMFDNRILEPIGELNTDKVRSAVANIFGKNFSPNIERKNLKAEISKKLSPRSSTLCAGCPHLGSYWAIKKVLEKEKGNPIVNGDIGCYEQGGYGLFSKKIPYSDEVNQRYKINSPYEILDTIYIMGSGIGLAQGQYHAGYKDKIIAVAGDSTFYHTCMPALVNAVYNNADITFVILDNTWTCMTGHQPNPTTGIRGNGDKSKNLIIEDIVKSIGVEVIKIADAYNIKDSIEAVNEALNYGGPSVVVLRRECALQVLRRKEKSGFTVTIDKEKCTGCKMCIQVGCPALVFKNRKASIDTLMCVNCGICTQVCKFGAIIERRDENEV